MAKNYTLAEAAKIIAEGKDLAAIAAIQTLLLQVTISLHSFPSSLRISQLTR